MYIQEALKGRPVKLSVIVPCYNESMTLFYCIKRLLLIQTPEVVLEIVIVDDCSDDGSYEIGKVLAREFDEVQIVRHPVNRGKGAALATGFRVSSGEIVAIQDADLEYDPADLKRLMAPIAAGVADVVIGSRFLSTGAHRVLYFWHFMGNRFLTFVSNMFTDLNLTDMESCYKVIRKSFIDRITIQESRFGFEPEIVAKLAHLHARIYEMGIDYHGRTYAEGKKIGAKDGIRALYCIFKYNLAYMPLPLKLLSGLISLGLLLFIIS